MGFSKHICLQIFTDFPVFLSIKYDGAIPVLNFIKCSLKTIFFFFFFNLSSSSYLPLVIYNIVNFDEVCSFK